MFTSTAVTPAASDSRAASSAYSSTMLPAIDTTARAPRESSHGRSRCKKASMPGPCSPIALSMPLGVSAIRGVGRPARGASITDLVTIAPILETSKNCASSRPAPAHPDAVRIGFGSSAWPSRPRRSVATGTCLLGLGVPRRAPGPGLPAGCPERVERDRSHIVPAHLLAPEYRAVDAGPDHPGDLIGSGNRQHAGHADPDPARHEFLHGDLHRNVVPPGQRRHLAEHGHRAAGVDDVGPGLVDDLAQHVGDDAAR